MTGTYRTGSALARQNFCTGIDVTGTASLSSTAPYIDLFETDTTDLNSRIVSNSSSLRLQTVADNGSGASNRLLIDHSTGDISFYEDTGTTAKFFWDASAERLGIGTSSPASLMHLKVAGTTGSNVLSLENDANKYDFRLTSANLVIRDGSSDRVTLDSSGRVGIGTSSPAAKLHATGTFGTTLTSGIRLDGLGTTTNNLAPIAFYTQSSNWGTQHAANIAAAQADGADGGAYLRFSTSPDGNTAPAERMRIDASGNTLLQTGGAALQWQRK